MAVISRYPNLSIQFIVTQCMAEFCLSVDRTASIIIPFLPVRNANLVNQDKVEWVQWTSGAKILLVSLISRHISCTVECKHIS